MTKVELHGSNGKRTLNLPSTAPTPTVNPADDAKVACTLHRKASFAAMSKLKPRLKALGSSDDAIWKGIKRKANVTSRSTLTPSNWAIISAKLNAALRNRTLLIDLVKEFDKDFVTETNPVVDCGNGFAFEGMSKTQLESELGFKL